MDLDQTMSGIVDKSNIVCRLKEMLPNFLADDSSSETEFSSRFIGYNKISAILLVFIASDFTYKCTRIKSDVASWNENVAAESNSKCEYERG